MKKVTSLSGGNEPGGLCHEKLLSSKEYYQQNMGHLKQTLVDEKLNDRGQKERFTLRSSEIATAPVQRPELQLRDDAINKERPQ
jgi:hypothetical protein